MIVKRIFNSIMNRYKWFKNKQGYNWILYMLLPVINNKIVITSYSGRGYSDNPKYITEELLKRDESLNVICLVKSINEMNLLPSNIKGCLIGSKKAVYHASTAAVWIDNSRKDYFKKKKKQLYIQTWHGNCTGKKIEKDAENKLSKSYVKIAIKDSKAIDLIISEGTFMTKIFKKSFWYNGLVAEVGSPRNDIFLDNGLCETTRKKVKQILNISDNKEIILYAPTFRDNGELLYYNVDFERLLRTCRLKFKTDFVVIVRLHPNIADKSHLMTYSDSVIDGSHYQDAQELLAASTVVISDYSSIMFDFTIKNGIAIRYAPDIKEYLEERGWYFELADYPYPIATNNDELNAIIQNFDNKLYLQDVNNFHDKCGLIKKTSSGICADIIMYYLKSGLSKKKTFDHYKYILK